MATDPLLIAVLSHLTLPNLKLASIVFILGYLIVRGAYKIELVDEHAMEQDKPRKGTLAIGTIVFILGLLAAIVLWLWVPFPTMQATIVRVPHMSTILTIAALVVFVYAVDFIKNLVIAYDVKESGGQKFAHIVVDAVNLVYGISFAFFAVPTLYYLFLHLTTPGY